MPSIEILVGGGFVALCIALALWAIVIRPRRGRHDIAEHLQSAGWLPHAGERSGTSSTTASFLRGLAIRSQPDEAGSHIEPGVFVDRQVEIAEEHDATIEQTFERRTSPMVAVLATQVEWEKAIAKGLVADRSSRLSRADVVWFGAREPVAVEDFELPFSGALEAGKRVMKALQMTGGGDPLSAALERARYDGAVDRVPAALGRLLRERHSDLTELVATVAVHPDGWLLSVPQHLAARSPERVTDLADAIMRAVRS